RRAQEWAAVRIAQSGLGPVVLHVTQHPMIVGGNGHRLRAVVPPREMMLLDGRPPCPDLPTLVAAHGGLGAGKAAGGGLAAGTWALGGQQPPLTLQSGDLFHSGVRLRDLSPLFAKWDHCRRGPQSAAPPHSPADPARRPR